MSRETVIIGTYQRAVHWCRKEDLPPPGRPGGPVFAGSIHHLMGRHGFRLVDLGGADLDLAEEAYLRASLP